MTNTLPSSHLRGQGLGVCPPPPSTGAGGRSGGTLAACTGVVSEGSAQVSWGCYQVLGPRSRPGCSGSRPSREASTHLSAPPRCCKWQHFLLTPGATNRLAPCSWLQLSALLTGGLGAGGAGLTPFNPLSWDTRVHICKAGLTAATPLWAAAQSQGAVGGENVRSPAQRKPSYLSVRVTLRMFLSANPRQHSEAPPSRPGPAPSRQSRDSEQRVKGQHCRLSLGRRCLQEAKAPNGGKKTTPRSQAGNARAHAAPCWSDGELQEQGRPAGVSPAPASARQSPGSHKANSCPKDRKQADTGWGASWQRTAPKYKRTRPAERGWPEVPADTHSFRVS